MTHTTSPSLPGAAALRRPVRFSQLALALLCCGALPALAQSPDRAQILEQIQALRAQQAQIVQLQQQNEASLRALESQLGLQAPPAAPAPAPAPVTVAASAPAPASRLKISGDLRLRAQGDYSDDDGRSRNSSQLRARVGANYQVNERLSIGGRLVTGDSDDPNSTDTQLSNWDDDLGVALDLAYAQLDFGNLKLTGGKIPQPFVRTDLVWDGDVNPQGVAASYKLPLANGGAFRANGLFQSVD